MEPSGKERKKNCKRKYELDFKAVKNQALARGLTWGSRFFRCKYPRHLTMDEADLKCFLLLRMFSPQIPSLPRLCLSGGSRFSSSSSPGSEISSAQSCGLPGSAPCALHLHVVAHKAQGGKPHPGPDPARRTRCKVNKKLKN